MPLLSPENGGPSGPNQAGRGVHGQYVYWIVMVQPTPEVIQSHNLKRPEDFTRETFRKLIVKAHKENGVTIAETVCFLEPHANGLLLRHRGLPSCGYPTGHAAFHSPILRASCGRLNHTSSDATRK